MNQSTSHQVDSRMTYRYCLLSVLSLGIGVPAASAAPCIPASWSNDVSTTVALRVSGRTLTLCAAGPSLRLQDGASVCWAIDPKTGGSSPLATPLVPAQSIRGDACKLGYCRAPRAATDADWPGERIAMSDDGALVGVMTLGGADNLGSETLELYDARTKKFLREVKLRPEPTADPEGVSDLWIGGAAIFVEGWMSGPTFRSIWHYKTSGAALGPLHGDLNVRELVQTDATHVVARDRGYQQVTVDLVSNQRRHEALPRPAACSAEQLLAAMWIDNAGEPGPAGEVKLTRSCLAAIRKAQAKRWKPLSVELDGVRYRLTASKGRWTITARPTTGAARTIDVPMCGK